MLRAHTSSSPTRSLNLYGWEHIDLAVVSALLARVPILFVGGQGAAKTDGAKAIAHAILGDRLRWAKYEAANIQTDDLVGFPDITSLKDKNVGFVGLPMSVWNVNAVVIDEITRVTPSTAAKLLELVRERSVYGIPTAIEIVFATANPPSREHAEVHKLGIALTSRFACVRVPDFAELSDDDIRGVLTTTPSGSWPWYPLTFTPEPIETILGLRKVCAAHKVHLSGRQARHLRSMLGAAAAARTIGCDYSADTLTTTVLACIPEATGLCAIHTDVPALTTALTTFFDEYLQSALPAVTDWPAYYAALTARVQACSSVEQARTLKTQVRVLAAAAKDHSDDVQEIMSTMVPLLVRYDEFLGQQPVMSLPDVLNRILS